MVARSIRAMCHDQYVLYLTYADPRSGVGGLERFLTDEIRLLHEQGISAVCLFPFSTRRSSRLNHYLSRFWGVIVDNRFCGFYDRDGIDHVVAEIRRAGRVPLEMHIHHLRNFNLDRVRGFMARYPLPVKWFLHDFYSVCPKFNLMRNDRTYCGAAPPSQEKCAGCISWSPEHLGRMRALLETVRARLTVVAPSESARRIWQTSFPDYAGRTVVLPHLMWAGSRPNEYRASPPTKAIRIAFVGATYQYKGWDSFKQLVCELTAAGAEYEFYHFGCSREVIPAIRRVPISFVCHGANAMTQALRDADIDIAFLWSLCPETYSYVLQECRLANTMILTNPNSGNIAATVSADDEGRIFPDYAGVRDYLLDDNRVRADVADFRGRRRQLPAAAIPNPSLLDMVSRSAPAMLPEPRAAGGRSRLADMLFVLKMLIHRVKKR